MDCAPSDYPSVRPSVSPMMTLTQKENNTESPTLTRRVFMPHITRESVFGQKVKVTKPRINSKRKAERTSNLEELLSTSSAISLEVQRSSCFVCD